MAGGELAAYLEREHPQTIAVVVSHLPVDRAADVLGRLAPALQEEVARRLVDLDAAAAEVVREVERGVEAWLATRIRSQQRRRAGLATLEGILQAADGQTQQQLRDNLKTIDRQLGGRAAPRSPQPPTFAELQQWDDAALAVLMERADTEVFVLALAGADRRFVERVIGMLPPAQGRTLLYALDHLGPTRLSDLEYAQRELTLIAQELLAKGQAGGDATRRLSLAA